MRFLKRSCSMWLSTVALIAAVAFAGAAAQAAEETVQGMLAAQIRMQGFACDKALGAAKDAKRSRPDHAVWMLRCSNANYRVSRAPDMVAKVEPLR